MSKLNRLNFRIVIRNITIFFMIAKTQTLEGITSKVDKDQHIILWDLDNCNLSEAISSLTRTQDKYDLSDIAIFSDRDNGYCAICYTVVPFMRMLRILVDTDYIDEGFIGYTAKRFKATLRTRRKDGRGKMEIKYIIKSFPTRAPDKLERILYDTGIVKEGVNIGNFG
jgi:hypothetical protein